jgi:hypothetical protein
MKLRNQEVHFNIIMKLRNQEVVITRHCVGSLSSAPPLLVLSTLRRTCLPPWSRAESEVSEA